MFTIHSNKNRGFTLIELLVVIAIIGILSSVVLASLNTARNRGTDTAVRGNLSNARSEAELFFDTAGNYTNICNTTGANVIGDSATAAASALGIALTNDAAGTTSNVVCNDSATAWAIQSMLRAQTGVFCVDSTGAATTSSATLISSGTDYTCS